MAKDLSNSSQAQTQQEQNNKKQEAEKRDIERSQWTRYMAALLYGVKKDSYILSGHHPEKPSASLAAGDESGEARDSGVYYMNGSHMNFTYDAAKGTLNYNFKAVAPEDRARSLREGLLFMLSQGTRDVTMDWPEAKDVTFENIAMALRLAEEYGMTINFGPKIEEWIKDDRLHRSPMEWIKNTNQERKAKSLQDALWQARDTLVVKQANLDAIQRFSLSGEKDIQALKDTKKLDVAKTDEEKVDRNQKLVDGVYGDKTATADQIKEIEKQIEDAEKRATDANARLEKLNKKLGETSTKVGDWQLNFDKVWLDENGKVNLARVKEDARPSVQMMQETDALLDHADKLIHKQKNMKGFPDRNNRDTLSLMKQAAIVASKTYAQIDQLKNEALAEHADLKERLNIWKKELETKLKDVKSAAKTKLDGEKEKVSSLTQQLTGVNNEIAEIKNKTQRINQEDAAKLSQLENSKTQLDAALNNATASKTQAEQAYADSDTKLKALVDGKMPENSALAKAEARLTTLEQSINSLARARDNLKEAFDERIKELEAKKGLAPRSSRPSMGT